MKERDQMTNLIRCLNKGQLQETLDELRIRKTWLSDVRRTGELKPIDKETIRKIANGESVNPSTIERLQNLLEFISGKRVDFNNELEAVNDYVIEPHWPLETTKISAGEPTDIAAVVSGLSKSTKFEYELCLERVTDTQKNSLLKLIEAIKLFRAPRKHSELSSPEDNLINQINRLKDIEQLSALTDVLISSGIKIFSCNYSMCRIIETDAYLDPHGDHPGLQHVYSEEKRVIIAFLPSNIENVNFHLHTGVKMPTESDLQGYPAKYFRPDNSPLVDVIQLGDLGEEYELNDDYRIFKRGYGILPDPDLPF